jgi:TetR/AcrR family transcriptional regulator, fatty acid metabolism regulator protein
MQVSRGSGSTATSRARRSQIVEAAIVTIAELGLHKASFARIAERAGLSSTRMISYHFDDRDELIEAVVSEVFMVAGAFIEPFVLASASPAGQLRRLIRGNALFYAQHRAHVRAVQDIWSAHRNADGSLRYGMDAHEMEFAVVSRILRDGQELGEFRPFDVRFMAITLRHALNGLATLIATDPDVDVESCIRELVAIFDGATRR